MTFTVDNVSFDNDAPAAAADGPYVNSGPTLTVDVAHGVLGNDSDPEGDTLTAAERTVATRVLARGYAIARAPDGTVVRSGAGLSRGDALDLTFAEGGASVTVDEPR